MFKGKKLQYGLVIIQLLASFATTQLATDGHFYKHESLQDPVSSDNSASMVLTQDIFGCNLDYSCPQIFKDKNGKISEANSQPTETKSSWKKISTPVVKSSKCDSSKFSDIVLIKIKFLIFANKFFI